MRSRTCFGCLGMYGFISLLSSGQTPGAFKRVGGSDPEHWRGGFGRHEPPKTGVAPAHALDPISAAVCPVSWTNLSDSSRGFVEASTGAPPDNASDKSADNAVCCR